MNEMPALLPLHAAATWFMTGVIWYVQIVHYPLFARVGEAGFAGFHARHTRWTGWVVAPAMLVELVTGLGLVIRPPATASPAAAALGLALIAVIWIATALLQVPAHRRLARRFDPVTLRRLVAGNWIRTAAWTARAVLVAWWLA